MNSYGMCDSFSLFFHCQSDLGADKKNEYTKKNVIQSSIFVSISYHISASVSLCCWGIYRYTKAEWNGFHIACDEKLKHLNEEDRSTQEYECQWHFPENGLVTRQSFYTRLSVTSNVTYSGYACSVLPWRCSLVRWEPVSEHWKPGKYLANHKSYDRPQAS